MNLRILYFSLVFSLITSTGVAGPSSGGGGMVVTCRNTAGKIISTDLLDVYEAKYLAQNNTKISIMQPTGSLDEDYYRLVSNTYRLQGNGHHPDKGASLANVKNFIDAVDWISVGQVLPFLGDQGLTSPLGEGCMLEQLAIFYDSTGRVALSEEIWRRLDSLSRAALVEHELFYRYERDFSENTSESSRSYVRQIISQSGFSPVKMGAETAKLFCSAQTSTTTGNIELTDLYIHQTPNSLGFQDLTLQFTQIAGRPLLVKSTALLSNLIFDVQQSWYLGARVLMPKSSTQNRVLKVPVVTDHRKDWEILFKFVSNQPVTIELLQDGVSISKSYFSNCW